MARRPETGQNRDVVIHIRLSQTEAEQLDLVRGTLTRSDWFRREALAVAVKRLEGRGKRQTQR